jgi:hypothetical protein
MRSAEACSAVGAGETPCSCWLHQAGHLRQRLPKAVLCNRHQLVVWCVSKLSPSCSRASLRALHPRRGVPHDGRYIVLVQLKAVPDASVFADGAERASVVGTTVSTIRDLAAVMVRNLSQVTACRAGNRTSFPLLGCSKGANVYTARLVHGLLLSTVLYEMRISVGPALRSAHAIDVCPLQAFVAWGWAIAASTLADGGVDAICACHHSLTSAERRLVAVAPPQRRQHRGANVGMSGLMVG